MKLLASKQELLGNHPHPPEPIKQDAAKTLQYPLSLFFFFKSHINLLKEHFATGKAFIGYPKSLNSDENAIVFNINLSDQCVWLQTK